MGELSIRRNRELAKPQYQKLGKAEKQSATTQAQQAASSRTSATVSETLRQLMTRVSQVQRHAREGRRTLQKGEAALAEVQDSLGRMEELAQEAAGSGRADRAALQAELEQLRREIDQIARDGAEAGLFQDGEAGDGLDALVDAVMEGLSARQDGVQSLPAWLLRGMAGEAPDAESLLSALGLDSTASGADVLAALGRLSLEGSPAAGYLASLYLGAVISGCTSSGVIDPDQAAEGLQQFLDLVAEGVSPDQALDQLTGGIFTSLADFQAQFTGGSAPGLDAFLTELLFAGGPELPGSSLLAMLAGGGGDMAMLMDLLAMLDGPGAGLMELLDGWATPDGAALPPQQSQAQAALPFEAAQLGTVQASGRDLSAAAFDPETGVLTLGGTEPLTLRGLGQDAPELLLTGSGDLTLHNVTTSLLTVEVPQARVAVPGEAVLTQVRLENGATLTLKAGGLVRIGLLRGEASGVLRLTGGAVVIEQSAAAAVVVDGPISLLAPEGVAVQNARGEALTPFDMVWKTLLPEWSALTALAVDGKQSRLVLPGSQPDPLRMWLLKGDDSKGWPAHTIALRGRDRAGRTATRYVYVRWDERRGSFREISMYPNPFTVTGGEVDVDWRYEEESHTLWILTGQVTAVSGGAGTDANLLPFSGRIALANGMGAVELTLNGVACRVSQGRAFHLGRGNAVTLLLQRGTENVFESGPGCAGISLGDGTSLCIDQAPGGRGLPDGVLTASGGAGGAGIGRDSGAAREAAGAIVIRGGVITATGTGGGAGIGGALGAPAGDIRIQGGTVTALASCAAAAIGAGIQGPCGDITISGSARVARAQGGGPDGDIGGCLFGGCGRVQVSAGTDIGGARLWNQQGLSLQMGESTMTLPRFRISARALRLDGLSLSTREAARAALSILTADRRWVNRLQGAYGEMYGQLGQSMYSAHSYIRVVRSTDEASALLSDARVALRQTPAGAFLTRQWNGDVGHLLR